MPAATIPDRPASHRWLRRAAVAAAVIAIAITGLYFGVPALLRHLLETRVAADIHRPVSVRDIHFNPFTLEAAVAGLEVKALEPGAPPLFALDNAFLDVSLASIWHRAPVLDRVTLERPRLALARKADGTYSIQDLLDAALAEHDGPPARFSLNNIEIRGGEIDFDDRPKQRKHQVRDLNVGIPFLSSLPYQTATKVVPHVAARVNGSPFALSGTTTPFARERDASLNIDLDGVSLPAYIAYIPVKLRARIASGTVSSHARLVFTEGDPQARSLWLSGEVSADNLVVQRDSGAEVVALPRTTAHIARLDFFRHTLVIDSLRFDKPTLNVRRTAGGALELAGPWVEVAPRAATPPSEAAAWRVDVENAAIAGGVVHIDDAAVKPAYRVTYNDLTMDATDLSTAKDKRAHVRVAMTSEFGAAAKADVDVIPATLEASGHIAIDKLALRRFQAYYADALNLDVQAGSFSIAGDFSYMPEASGAKFTIAAGAANFDGLKLALPGERAPLWSVPRLDLENIAIDVPARRVDIGSVTSSKGVLSVRRERDGNINFGRTLKANASTGKHDGHDAAGTATGKANDDDTTWAVLARRMVFSQYMVNVADEVPTPPVAMALRNTEFIGETLTNARGKRGRVSLKATTGTGGRIALTGPLATNPFAVDLAIDASGVALQPFQPYIDPYVGLAVTAGTLATKGRLRFGVADGGGRDREPATPARFSGDVTISGFAALDKPSRDDLVRFGRFALSGIDLVSEPLKVGIGAVAVDDFFARVILYSDATLNLVRVMQSGVPAEGPTAGRDDASPVAQTPSAAATTGRDDASQVAQPPPPAAAAGKALPVTIGRIELNRGTVRYSDFYVRPNYSANLTEVSGTVSEMSATRAGAVDLAAKVERTAPVELKGTINPFAQQLTLDLTGKARDVDLPPLSPYSVKYAGYGITKGTLSFDVHYRIDNRKLVADNRLKLDQLTFGEHVDSPTATKLPVLLAVALLKDVHGVIDIDLPISGSLDDPKFSVGGLIVRVIVNLLTKAVTAPFALLGAAFGGGEELSYIAFDAGHATLTQAAAAKLDTLGKSLASRPSLKLDIAGRVDPAVDADALRREAVEHAIREQKVRELAAAGTAPADASEVKVSADERLRYLTAAYKDAPIKDRPRNFFGVLKDVPAAEMEAMLYASTGADAEALRALAQRRAQAVKQGLVSRGVAADRLFVVTTAPAKEAASAPPMRADLSLK